MNWKLFGAMAALIGVGASVALGQGTSTTIVEANYISNVFGQSNFVKNPNAKLNNANVTVSSATVTRSATTPLVATSEFNITTSTATGYADWSLRTFDAGMKNQNCEARFTYRGFSVGSTTAQILQGANVIAQLTLTPSATDPRIASINFPCGDLSAATTFRLQQATAALTGTNEIGGIYVGLATNQANVAQAEEAGKYTMTGATSCIWSTSSTTFTAYAADADCNTAAVTGAATTSAGKIPGATFSNLKPGKYQFIVSFTGFKMGTVNDAIAFRLGDGTTYSSLVLPYVNSTISYYMPTTLIYTTEYTTVTSPTIQIYAFTGSASNLAEINNSNSSYKFELTAYRFPSSSELVVTPERQNVWGGVNHTGTANTGIGDGVAASTTFTTYNAAAWSTTRTLKGKCIAPVTGNDVGCQIENMPVGSYSVSFSGLQYIRLTAAGVVTCAVKIRETTTSTDVAIGTGKIQFVTADNTPTYKSAAIDGVFKNTAIANRNFVIQGAKTFDTTSGNTGGCYLFANNGPSDFTDVNITVTPLDQPSNSALYVQGPVLGAQTGAAIPSGYVGQWSTTTLATDKALTATNTYGSLTTYTVPAGVWQVYPRATSVWGTIQPQITRFEMRTAKSSGTGSVNGQTGNLNYYPCGNMWPSTLNVYRVDLACTPLSVTSDGTMVLTFDYVLNGVQAGNNSFTVDLFRLN